MKDNYIYYGIFLTAESRDKIIYEVSNMEFYNELMKRSSRMLVDHCTLLYHSQEKNYPSVKEQLVRIENNMAGMATELIPMLVNRIGYLNNKVMAVGVDLKNTIPCANVYPHITICTFADGKPVDSNDIIAWNEIEYPFYVYGEFRKVMKP